MKTTYRYIALALAVSLARTSATHSKPKPKPNLSKAAQVPRLGKYTGIWVGTQSDFGRAEPDLILLPGNRYKQMNKIGRYKYSPKTRQIDWIGGSIPKDWVGFFKPRGFEDSKYDTIVIRDRKDVAEANKRDLRWYNAR